MHLDDEYEYDEDFVESYDEVGSTEQDDSDDYSTEMYEDVDNAASTDTDDFVDDSAFMSPEEAESFQQAVVQQSIPLEKPASQSPASTSGQELSVIAEQDFPSIAFNELMSGSNFAPGALDKLLYWVFTQKPFVGASATLSDVRNYLAFGMHVKSEGNANSLWAISVKTSTLPDSCFLSRPGHTFDFSTIENMPPEGSSPEQFLVNATDTTKLIYLAYKLIRHLKPDFDSSKARSVSDAIRKQLVDTKQQGQLTLDTIYSILQNAIAQAVASNVVESQPVVATENRFISDFITKQVNAYLEDTREFYSNCFKSAKATIVFSTRNAFTGALVPVFLSRGDDDYTVQLCSNDYATENTDVDKQKLNSYCYSRVLSTGVSLLDSLKQANISGTTLSVDNSAAVPISNGCIRVADLLQSFTGYIAEIVTKLYSVPYDLSSSASLAQCATDYWAPHIAALPVLGFVTMDGKRASSYDEFETNFKDLLCTLLRNIMRSILGEDIINKYTADAVSATSGHLSAICSAFFTLYSHVVAITEFKPTAVGYRYANADMKVYVQGIASVPSDNRTPEMIAALDPDSTNRVARYGSYLYRVTPDKEAFEKEVNFGYKALLELHKDNIQLSLDNVLIGSTLEGENVFMRLSASNIMAVNIFGGSRSGKGVMTLSILGTAIADGNPFMYFDNKPEMALTLWKLERTLGIPMLVVDGLASETMVQAVSPRVYNAKVNNHFDRFMQAFEKGESSLSAETFNSKSVSSNSGNSQLYSLREVLCMYCLLLKYCSLATAISMHDFDMITMAKGSSEKQRTLESERYVPDRKKLICVVDEINGLLKLYNSVRDGLVNKLKTAQRCAVTVRADLMKERTKLKDDIVKLSKPGKDGTVDVNQINAKNIELNRIQEQLEKQWSTLDVYTKVLSFIGFGSAATAGSNGYSVSKQQPDFASDAELFMRVQGGTAGNLLFINIGQNKDEVAKSRETYPLAPLMDCNSSDVLGNDNVDSIRDNIVKGKSCLEYINGKGIRKRDANVGYFAFGNTAFKSYLTLNENDYNPDGNNGAGADGLYTRQCAKWITNVKKRRELFFDEETHQNIAGVGFEGYMRMIAGFSGNESAALASLSAGYKIAERVLKERGIYAKHGYTCPEDWLYDMDPESFYSVTQLKTGVVSTSKDSNAASPVNNSSFNPLQGLAHTNVQVSQTRYGTSTQEQIVAIDKALKSVQQVYRFFKNPAVKQAYITGSDTNTIRTAMSLANDAIELLNSVSPPECPACKELEQLIDASLQYKELWKSAKAAQM